MHTRQKCLLTVVKLNSPTWKVTVHEDSRTQEQESQVIIVLELEGESMEGDGGHVKCDRPGSDDAEPTIMEKWSMLGMGWGDMVVTINTSIRKKKILLHPVCYLAGPSGSACSPQWQLPNNKWRHLITFPRVQQNLKSCWYITGLCTVSSWSKWHLWTAPYRVRHREQGWDDYHPSRPSNFFAEEEQELCEWNVVSE